MLPRSPVGVLGDVERSSDAPVADREEGSGGKGSVWEFADSRRETPPRVVERAWASFDSTRVWSGDVEGASETPGADCV